MTDNPEITIDRAERIVNLIADGVPIAAIEICINRSADGETLGVVLGVLEDLHNDGLIEVTK